MSSRDQMTIKELKEALKKFGAKVSGRKKDLFEWYDDQLFRVDAVHTTLSTVCV